MEVTFTTTQFFWFLLVIPVFLVLNHFLMKLVRKQAFEFANFPALERVAKKPKMPRNMLLLAVRMLVFFLIIMAISGATLWYTGKSSEFDFVLAIDSSSSMLADDFAPNRLEAAKEAAKSFVDNLPSETEVGVVSFAGTSYIDQRLTSDHSAVKDVIDSISVKRIGGTDLGEAIITSANLLLAEDRARVIILLTDGKSNVGVPVQDAIDYANANHITVHTVGAATEEGGYFPLANVTLTLDKAELEFIADSTGGKFYDANDKDALFSAYRELSEVREKKLSMNLSVIFMLIAFILLLQDWLLLNTSFRVIP